MIFLLAYLLGFNLSIAVAVGFIALAGVAAEIGVLVLTFINQTQIKLRNENPQLDSSQLMQAVYEGTAQRVRPLP